MNADPLLQDCGVGTYSASIASFLASMSSGKKLITDPSFNTNCPPIGTINCEFYWWPWSGCRADKTQIMRYTISKYPSKDGTACQYADGYGEASRIKSTHGDGHCMDVNYGGGNTLIMYPCHDGNNQKFYFSS